MKNINPELKIGVADDYTKEIVDEMTEEAKALLPVLRKAKKKASASFSVDWLVINGQIYRGPEETEEFPFYAKDFSSESLSDQDSFGNPSCKVSLHIFKGVVYI